jgi:histidyl-tRNA synthetase
VLVTQFDAARFGAYVGVGARLRRRGIAVEVFPEAKKVGKQLEYANRKGHRVVLIAGPDEFAAGTWQVKALATGEQRTVPDTELVDAVQQLLNPV